MPSPGCPDLLLVRQRASLYCNFVRPQGAARPLGCPRPDTGSAEDTGMNGLGRSTWTTKPGVATSIHCVSPAFHLTSSLLLLFDLGCAYGKESPCLSEGEGRARGTPSLAQAVTVIAGVGDISTVPAFWWLCCVETPATPCALSNLPAVTKESVCLSSSPHPEFQFPPNSLSRQPLPLPWRCGFADAACCLCPSCRRISPCGRSCSSGMWSAGWGSSPFSAKSSAP